jgi:hypothetical protein
MGKTFHSMFSDFESEMLCQIYVHNSLPDVDLCNAYYRITDKNVLKNLFFGHPGEEISKDKILEQIRKRENGTLSAPKPRFGAKAIYRLIRDSIWKLSRWYSKDLKAWLDREKPTCIFLAPGYAKFIYDLALRISKDRGLPIVTYICDDYYFVKKPKKLLEKICFYGIREKTNKLMAHTSRLIVISNEMKSLYENNFCVKTDLIMTGASFPCKNKLIKTDSVKTISYFGNLADGRYKSLLDICRAVEKINLEMNFDIKVKIYTAETALEYLNEFNSIKCVDMCGFVSGDVYKTAFEKSDILIHTESFDTEYIDLVKHSVSTKIADSLASGIPLLAYGPADISSMQHLIRNKCAIVATSNYELKNVLEKNIFDVKYLNNIIGRALETANQYHNQKANSAKLKAIFHEVRN